MDNTQRDSLLVGMSKDVGEIKGTLTQYTRTTDLRLASLERGKVGWRAFTSIVSVVIGSTIAAIKYVFDRGGA